MRPFLCSLELFARVHARACARRGVGGLAAGGLVVLPVVVDADAELLPLVELVVPVALEVLGVVAEKPDEEEPHVDVAPKGVKAVEELTSLTLTVSNPFVKPSDRAVCHHKSIERW